MKDLHLYILEFELHYFVDLGRLNGDKNINFP